MTNIDHVCNVFNLVNWHYVRLWSISIAIPDIAGALYAMMMKKKSAVQTLPVLDEKQKSMSEYINIH